MPALEVNAVGAAAFEGSDSTTETTYTAKAVRCFCRLRPLVAFVVYVVNGLSSGFRLHGSLTGQDVQILPHDLTPLLRATSLMAGHRSRGLPSAPGPAW